MKQNIVFNNIFFYMKFSNIYISIIKLNRNPHLQSILLRLIFTTLIISTFLQNIRSILVLYTSVNSSLIHVLTGSMLFSFTSLVICMMIPKFYNTHNNVDVTTLGYKLMFKFVITRFIYSFVVGCIVVSTMKATIFYMNTHDTFYSFLISLLSIQILAMLWELSFVYLGELLDIDLYRVYMNDHHRTRTASYFWGDGKDTGPGNNGNNNPQDGTGLVVASNSNEEEWTDGNPTGDHTLPGNVAVPLFVDPQGDRRSWGPSGGPCGPSPGAWDDWRVGRTTKDLVNPRVILGNNIPLSCADDWMDSEGVIIKVLPNIPNGEVGQLMMYSLINQEARLNLNEIAEPLVYVQVKKGISTGFRATLDRHIQIGRELYYRRWDMAVADYYDAGQAFGTRPYQINSRYWYPKIDSLITRYLRREYILRDQYIMLRANSPILNKVAFDSSFNPWIRWRIVSNDDLIYQPPGRRHLFPSSKLTDSKFLR